MGQWAKLSYPTKVDNVDTTFCSKEKRNCRGGTTGSFKQGSCLENVQAGVHVFFCFFLCVHCISDLRTFVSPTAQCGNGPVRPSCRVPCCALLYIMD